MESLCNSRCKTCVYRTNLNVGLVACFYLINTGHSRPCEAGSKCTEYKRGTPQDRSNPVIVTKIVLKKCSECGTMIRMSPCQKYCKECAKKVNNRNAMEKVKATRQAERDAEFAKIKYCGACGSEFHSCKTNVVYCSKCSMSYDRAKRMKRKRIEALKNDN